MGEEKKKEIATGAVDAPPLKTKETVDAPPLDIGQDKTNISMDSGKTKKSK